MQGSQWTRFPVSRHAPLFAFTELIGSPVTTAYAASAQLPVLDSPPYQGKVTLSITVFTSIGHAYTTREPLLYAPAYRTPLFCMNPSTSNCKDPITVSLLRHQVKQTLGGYRGTRKPDRNRHHPPTKLLSRCGSGANAGVIRRGAPS